MARKGRIEFSGAVYHVLDRGNRREPIVHRDGDREAFVRTLGETCSRAGWRLHAFVLMRNHYHLLLETPQPNLVAGMRWFQTTWTVRFNRFHGLSGHLFQGRYKAILVDPEESGYLTTLSDYIHLNPVRAGLIGLEDKLFGYPWSSYPWYAALAGRPSWFEPERVLGELGWKDDKAGRRCYAERMRGRAVGGARGAGGKAACRAQSRLVPGERELSGASLALMGSQECGEEGTRDGCKLAARSWKGTSEQTAARGFELVGAARGRAGRVEKE